VTNALFAQAAANTFSTDGFGEILRFGFEAGLLWWMITRAFPSLLERGEAKHTEAREHFEKILEKVESNRAVAAKDGHDAARSLGAAIEHQCEAIRGNSSAIDRLANQVVESRK